MRRVYLLVLIFIFAFAFFLRFYKLGEVPYGFYQDESAIGYNAYSILKTGKDEHGQSLPLYFKSFGDYKLPAYVYSAIIPIKFFGLTEFAVRFPSALFGFLTVIAFYFFLKEITKDKNIPIVATALLALNPWHLHYSRATFEVSIALFLFVLGTHLLYKSFAAKRKGMFFLGTLCFILDIYTYNLTRLLSPLLFVLLIFIYRQHVKVVAKRELMMTLFVSAILLVPFFATLLGRGGVNSGLGTFILTSAQIQAPLLEFRSYLIELPTLFTKVFFNQWAQTLWQYFQNVASYFSISFFFISGSSHGNHGIGNVGQLYLFELPLIIFGVVRVVRERRSWGKFLMLWTVVVILVASLTREAPHGTRSFFLVVPLTIFSAMGFLTFYRWIKTIKGGLGKTALLLGVGFIIYSLIYYFASYYVRFPVAYAKAWRLEDKALSLYIKENEGNYEKILFDKKAGFIYTSFLFYTAYNPSEFQKSVVRGADDSEGFSQVLSFGKYEFKDIDWSRDFKKGNLVITTVDRKPEALIASKIFTYPKRPVVIAEGQNILQYPVEEVAYVLVEER